MWYICLRSSTLVPLYGKNKSSNGLQRGSNRIITAPSFRERVLPPLIVNAKVWME